MNKSLIFRWAKEPWEFQQIHQLNYETFVKEIPQHQPNAAEILIDAFDQENHYAIGVLGDRVVGMMAVRGNRPFSLDRKLQNVDAYLPPQSRVCEIRLLAVEKEFRHGAILPGLVRLIADYARDQGFDVAIISGTVRQLRLYEHLGFKPFGPRVGTSDASFQPMLLTWEAFDKAAAATIMAGVRSISFLPGPVMLRPSVEQAFYQPPISHRGEMFLRLFENVQQRLFRLTQARAVVLLQGSGTLANDAIAAQLSLLSERGLVVTHGEFGSRLVDHARRWSLSFETLQKPWGSVVQPGDIEFILDQHPDVRWLWAVHCETSTGVLQDLDELKSLCRARGVRLCLDSISSLGTVLVDLRGVYLASGVSGKGLGAYPGISMVFADHAFASAASLPRYLDLGFYASSDGIPFTFSSNLLSALAKALEYADPQQSFEPAFHRSQMIRRKLMEWNCEMMAPQEHASPAVITFRPPPSVQAQTLARKMASAGFLLSYQSAYLAQRQWLQICLMGGISEKDVQSMLACLGAMLRNAVPRRRELVS